MCVRNLRTLTRVTVVLDVTAISFESTCVCG